MIIGHGDIASVLPDREDRVYFASGVSNSAETRQSEFDREMDLLVKQKYNKHLVYFSSLCIFYSNTPYAKHKRAMEKAVKTFHHHTIIRLGNITWGINPHTLLNYLRDNPDAPIQDAYRYVITKEEFLHWIDLIPNWNCEMNITGEMLKVSEIAYRSRL